MNIVVIYGRKNCHLCQVAKKKYPDAEYIDIDKLNEKEKKHFLVHASNYGIRSLPILINDKGSMITFSNH